MATGDVDKELQRLRAGLRALGERLEADRQGTMGDGGAGGNLTLLARLDERIKGLDVKLDRYHDDFCKWQDDHETRIRELEKKQGRSVWYDMGAGAVAAAGTVLAAIGLRS